MAHARQFADAYADRLEHYIEGRMHALDIPEEYMAESQTGSHEGAEALAAETELAVSDGARRILRAMAGRGR